jgi:hypothetical protein
MNSERYNSLLDTQLQELSKQLGVDIEILREKAKSFERGGIVFIPNERPLDQIVATAVSMAKALCVYNLGRRAASQWLQSARQLLEPKERTN